MINFCNDNKTVIVIIYFYSYTPRISCYVVYFIFFSCFLLFPVHMPIFSTGLQNLLAILQTVYMILKNEEKEK